MHTRRPRRRSRERTELLAAAVKPCGRPAESAAVDESAESRAPAPVTPELCPIEVVGQTDVGCRRSENQDAFGDFEDDLGYRLLVVADGMGGHRGGATASRICVETVGEAFRGSSDPLPDRIARGLERANERILEQAALDPDLEGMGTTAVVLAFTPRGEAVVAWVGDSRAYRLRDGQLEQLTQDHSLVAEWVRLGVISSDEAASHPRRHELLRSVGGSSGVEVDVTRVNARPGDRFLLCSDGLCGEVPEQEIAQDLAGDAASAVRSLIERANRAGGPDNVTVQVATLGDLVPGQPLLPIAQRSGRAAFWLAAAAGGMFLIAGWFALRPADPRPEPPLRQVVERPAPPAPEIAPPPSQPAPVIPAPPPRPAPQQLAQRPEPPAPEPAAAEIDPAQAIEAFLSAWSSAVTERDYPRYRSLGLELSEDEFAAAYVDRSGLELRLELFDWRRAGSDRLAVHMLATTTYESGGLARRIQEERSLLLDETPTGLRYAGRWE